MPTPQKDYKSYLCDLEKLADEYLVKKAPALPDGVKEAIVKFGPVDFTYSHGYVRPSHLRILRNRNFYDAI